MHKKLQKIHEINNVKNLYLVKLVLYWVAGVVSCEENVAMPLFPHYEPCRQRLSVKLIFMLLILFLEPPLVFYILTPFLVYCLMLSPFDLTYLLWRYLLIYLLVEIAVKSLICSFFPCWISVCIVYFYVVIIF